VPVEFWYQMDIALLECCDGILVLPGWEKSTGTKRELDYAIALTMPVFYYGDFADETYQGEWENLLAWAKS
jgi:nucleoside 2-deoxyribosyltransferase